MTAINTIYQLYQIYIDHDDVTHYLLTTAHRINIEDAEKENNHE